MFFYRAAIQVFTIYLWQVDQLDRICKTKKAAQRRLFKISVFDVQSINKHTVTIAEEFVFFFDCFAIGMHHQFVPTECADQHQQG